MFYFIRYSFLSICSEKIDIFLYLEIVQFSHFDFIRIDMTRLKPLDTKGTFDVSYSACRRNPSFLKLLVYDKMK